MKSANTLKDELTAAVHVSRTGFGQCTSGNSLGSTTMTLPNSKIVSPERRCNIILFGVPEKKSLSEEKHSIDDILKFVSGRSIPWKDAFRIGRKKSSEDICENTRP